MSIQKSIAILIILTLSSSCIEFSSILAPKSHRCFFQILTQNQKYKIDIYPQPTPIPQPQLQLYYTFTIHSLNKSSSFFQLQHSRTQIPTAQSLHIHKLATTSSTYKFCIYNPSLIYNLSYDISIQSGLELLELQLLPDHSDTQNIVMEMEWVRKQIQGLREIYERVGQMRSQAENVSKLVNGKLILCAIGFSLIAVLVNGFFYSKIRKALHQRKTI